MTDPFAAAACRGMDDSPWLDPPANRAAPAAEACMSCRALQPCRDYTRRLVDRAVVPAGVVQAGLRWPVVTVSPRRARAMLAAAG